MKEEKVKISRFWTRDAASPRSNDSLSNHKTSRFEIRKFIPAVT